MRAISILSFLCFLTFSAHAQWNVVHSGCNAGLSDLFFVNPDTGYVIGVNAPDSYILKTMDGGANWDSIIVEDFRVRTMYFPSADTGYIAGFYGSQISILRTVDSGINWEQGAMGILNGNTGPLPISFFNNNTGIISFPYTGAARTTDSGIFWTQLEDFPVGGKRDHDIRNNVFVGLDGAILVWSTDLGETFSGDTLYYQGSHYNLSVWDERFISCAGGNNGFALGFETFSFGIITIGNILSNAYEIQYFPDRQRVWDVCWAGEHTMYGISTSIHLGDDHPNFFIKSIDGGQTWYEQGTPEYGYPGTNKLFCVNDSVCYAIGGAGCKIYKTSNGGGPLLDPIQNITLSTSRIENIPSVSMFPNPTSGKLKIESKNEQIKHVELYDLQGKKLFESFPNNHSQMLNLEALKNGLYIIQVSIGENILSGKIVKN